MALERDEQAGCSGILSTNADVYMLFAHSCTHITYPCTCPHTKNRTCTTDEVAAHGLPASLETDCDTSTAKQLGACVACSSQP